MSITIEERSWIAEQLESGQTPDAVTDALVHRRARADVDEVVRFLDSAEQGHRREMEHAYYAILAPQPEPTLTEDAAGVQTLTYPPRQEYMVLVANLAAFCKEHGLDLKKMEQVVAGRLQDYKGWASAGNNGNYFCRSYGYMPAPTAEIRPAEKQIGGPRKRFLPATPLIDWSPKK